jgi:hypothetical protein
MAMRFGMVDARLVGMLMGMQAVGVRDMGVMGGLLMVAGLVMIRRFVMMAGGLFVVMGGLPVMFSTFVSCRHIHVLREVITLETIGNPALLLSGPPIGGDILCDYEKR